MLHKYGVRLGPGRRRRMTGEKQDAKRVRVYGQENRKFGRRTYGCRASWKQRNSLQGNSWKENRYNLAQQRLNAGIKGSNPVQGNVKM
jgi:hypothetical protein